LFAYVGASVQDLFVKRQVDLLCDDGRRSLIIFAGDIVIVGAVGVSLIGGNDFRDVGLLIGTGELTGEREGCGGVDA